MINDAADPKPLESNISPPSRGGEEGEGVENNRHKIPPPYPPVNGAGIIWECIEEFFDYIVIARNEVTWQSHVPGLLHRPESFQDFFQR